MKIIFNQKGQSLLEVVIAVSIVIIILVALVSASSVSVRNSTFSNNKSIANKYLNEGIEAVRSIRDRSWTTLYDTATPPDNVRGLVLASGVWNFTAPGVISDIIPANLPQPSFTRSVSFSNISSTSVDVLVRVSWYQSGQTFSSQATVTLTRWYN